MGESLSMEVLWAAQLVRFTIDSERGYGMETNDRALRFTAATPELWGAVYMMLIFTLAARAFHGWERLGGKQLEWPDALVIAVDLLVCPVPLVIGVAFRRLLKKEVHRSLLNSRTYRICNFWIAQILIIAYITMVL
jgi:hypothetical protein